MSDKLATYLIPTILVLWGAIGLFVLKKEIHIPRHPSLRLRRSLRRLVGWSETSS